MNQRLKWEIEISLKCPYQQTRTDILIEIGKQLKEKKG